MDQYQDTLIKSNKTKNSDDDEDENWDDQDFLDLLEDDSFGGDKYREQRVQELAQQMKESRNHIERSTVRTLTSEAELFELTTSTAASNGLLKTNSSSGTAKKSNVPTVIVHFFHPDFPTCKLMDKRLQELASRHFHTALFVRIAASDCPFLATRLEIQILPCVIAYVNGVERKRLLGFGELGNEPTKLDVQVLEGVFVRSGVLQRVSGSSNGGGKSILGFQGSSIRGAKKASYENDDDDDDDWD